MSRSQVLGASAQLLSAPGLRILVLCWAASLCQACLDFPTWGFETDIPENSGCRDLGSSEQTGSEPCWIVEPGEVHFGTRGLGQQTSYPVTIRACSDAVAPLKIYRIVMESGEELSPNFGVDYTGLAHVPEPWNPLEVSGDGIVAFNVTFSPNSLGPLESNGLPSLERGLVHIDTNLPEASIDIPVDGAGVECPTAIIRCSSGEEVIPQTLLHLNGAQSYSPNGAITKYEWSVIQPPLSASVFVPSDGYPKPAFEANVAGTYHFRLHVWDSMGTKSCTPGTYQVMVIPDEAIHVELLWHTPGDADETDTGPDAGSDLDLHFAHPWAKQPDIDLDGLPDPWFDTLFDCFWFNTNPDWGSYQPGLNDNPGMDRDDTDGAGPENVNLALPENVHYKVGIHYWNEHGYGVSYATVRVYIYSTLVFEGKDVLLQDQDMWEVATVDWPSGKVTQIPGQSGPYKITPQYDNPDFYPD